MRRRTDFRIAKKRLDNTCARFSSGDAVCTAPPGYYPSADAPGLAHVRRGCFVVLLTSQKVPVSPQVKRTAYSATASYARATRVRNETDWLPPDRGRYRRMYLARTHAPLASSDRTRDSSPHGVRSTDSGAKHARYLGTGCSDRWLPISLTASSSTFLRRRTLRHTARQQRSNAISGVSIPNVPAHFPEQIWATRDFFHHRDTEAQSRR